MDECRPSAGSTTTAEDCVRAISAGQDCAEAYERLATILLDLNRQDAATFARDVSLEIKRRRENNTWTGDITVGVTPQELAKFFYRTGLALASAGQLNPSCLCFEAASAWAPDIALYKSNWAGALLMAQRDEEALAAATDAVKLAPEFGPAWTNLGKALSYQDRIDDAIAALQRAMALAQTEQIQLATGEDLGCTLLRARRVGEAIDIFRAILSKAPHQARSHLNLAVALLTNGEWKEGWEEFEWRPWASISSCGATLGAARWQGQNVAGKTILLQTEYGFGDSIQFIRYATLLQERGAKVTVRSEPELTRLFISASGVAVACDLTEEIPVHDFWSPLLSLPRVFGSTVDNVPRDVPYLHPIPSLVYDWSRRLAAERRPLIGLAWAGDPKHGSFDQRRSITFPNLSALPQIGATFVSLQKGYASSQLSSAPSAMRIVDYSGEFKDFAETAAVIANLDLVITVDTSVAHLAGDIGKPVWMLCRYDADWRWLIERSDSVWYPTMRLFRQRTEGDWAAVFAQVGAELKRMAGRTFGQ